MTATGEPRDGGGHTPGEGVRWERRSRWLAALLLVVHASLLAATAQLDSPTWDEPAHLASGLCMIDRGSFALYRVNGPLVRLAAAAGAMLADPQLDWSHFSEDPGARPEFAVGMDLIAANGPRVFWIITLARWACIPFSLLGGLTCFLWARDLHGPMAGVAATAAWCVSPNVLGHGHLITSDIAATSLGVTACYLFWRWLRAPNAWSAVGAGVALGLALLTKSTWLPLGLLFPVTWLAVHATERPLVRPVLARRAALLAGLLVLSVVVLNAGYLGRGTFRALGDYDFVSPTLTGRAPTGSTDGPGNRFRGTALGVLPVPLPADYVQGIDQQKVSLDRAWLSYWNGRFRQGGAWWFYPYGLAVKLPIGTWVAFLVAAVLAVARPRTWSASWRAELCLWAPAIMVLLLVCSQTGRTQHVRYLWPLLPFVFIHSSRLLRHGTLRRWPAGIALAALAFTTLSSMRQHPHSLSYFNELAGGPRRGSWHLLDSNVDWGQDLLHLARWHREHPEARPFHLAYFGPVDPRLAGIDFTLPPSGHPIRTDDPSWKRAPAPGWHAVSVNYLRGYRWYAHDGTGGIERVGEEDFTWLESWEPVARAGHSILVFHVTEEEAKPPDP